MRGDITGFEMLILSLLLILYFSVGFYIGGLFGQKKLFRTTDGVPVYFGSKICYINPDKKIIEGTVCIIYDSGHISPKEDREKTWQVNNCYSSPKAAVQSKEYKEWNS